MPANPVFDQYFAWLDCGSCRLPFQAGGATQSGRLGGHTINQDALALISRETYITGVVCDGCGTSEIGQSNNEVGARLIAGATAVLLNEVLQRSPVHELAAHVGDFESTLCERILAAARSLFREDGLSPALHSYFMTTILAFAIDARSYIIFGCGDGFFALNSQFNSLDQNAGAYLAGRLVDNLEAWQARVDAGQGALRILAQGESASLHSLLLATDGFEDLVSEFPRQLQELLGSAPPGASSGFDQNTIIDFRIRFWHIPELQQWAELRDAYDDRSFLLVRRILPEIPEPSRSPEIPSPKEVSPQCSESPKPTSADAEVSSPPSPKRQPRISRASSRRKSAGKKKRRRRS